MGFIQVMRVGKSIKEENLWETKETKPVYPHSISSKSPVPTAICLPEPASSGGRQKFRVRSGYLS